MEIEALGPFDPVLLSPSETGAVRAGRNQPVQHLDEDGPLDGKLEAPSGEQGLDHRRTAGLEPQPIEDQRRSDPAGCDAGQLSPAVLGEHEQRLREARARLQERIEPAALLELIEPTERTENTLTAAPALPSILHDLQIGVALDRLLADEHGGSPVDIRRIALFLLRHNGNLAESWHQD